MQKEKLTRDDLRSIPNGGSITIALPSAQACYSAKTLAYQAQHIMNCKFSVRADFTENTLTITRSAL